MPRSLGTSLTAGATSKMVTQINEISPELETLKQRGFDVKRSGSTQIIASKAGESYVYTFTGNKGDNALQFRRIDKSGASEFFTREEFKKRIPDAPLSQSTAGFVGGIVQTESARVQREGSFKTALALGTERKQRARAASPQTFTLPQLQERRRRRFETVDKIGVLTKKIEARQEFLSLFSSPQNMSLARQPTPRSDIFTKPGFYTKGGSKIVEFKLPKAPQFKDLPLITLTGDQKPPTQLQKDRQLALRTAGTGSIKGLRGTVAGLTAGVGASVGSSLLFLKQAALHPIKTTTGTVVGIGSVGKEFFKTGSFTGASKLTTIAKTEPAFAAGFVGTEVAVAKGTGAAATKLKGITSAALTRVSPFFKKADKAGIINLDVVQKLTPKKAATTLAKQGKIDFKFVSSFDDVGTSGMFTDVTKKGRKAGIKPKIEIKKGFSKKFTQEVISHELIHYKISKKIPGAIIDFESRAIPYRFQPSEIAAFGLESPTKKVAIKSTKQLTIANIAFDEPLKLQARRAGTLVDAASAQRGLFRRFEKSIVVDKPLPLPDSPPLEKAFFADPTGKVRPSRLGIRKEPQKAASIIDVLSGDVTLKQAKPQALFFPDVPIEKLPKDIGIKLKAGKILTPKEALKLQEFQLTPSGKFKPIGFLSKEPEILLAPGEIITRKKSLGVTLVGQKKILGINIIGTGKRVPIFQAAIETPSKTLKGSAILKPGGIVDDLSKGLRKVDISSRVTSKPFLAPETFISPLIAPSKTLSFAPSLKVKSLVTSSRLPASARLASAPLSLPKSLTKSLGLSVRPSTKVVPSLALSLSLSPRSRPSVSPSIRPFPSLIGSLPSISRIRSPPRRIGGSSPPPPPVIRRPPPPIIRRPPPPPPRRRTPPPPTIKITTPPPPKFNFEIKEKKSKKVKDPFRQFKFQPSLVAGVEKIFGKRPKRLTGLGIRPLTLRKK